MTDTVLPPLITMTTTTTTTTMAPELINGLDNKF